mgnify:CR=1 FL=1|jgi:hypothetical protein
MATKKATKTKKTAPKKAAAKAAPAPAPELPYITAADAVAALVGLDEMRGPKIPPSVPPTVVAHARALLREVARHCKDSQGTRLAIINIIEGVHALKG